MGEIVKSTHKAEVVSVQLENHPNADSLSVVKIYGYTAVVRTTDWVSIDKGVYIVPDSLVPQREEFTFLFDKNKRYNINDIGESIKSENGAYARITAVRLRGILSYGLLIPAPEESQLGDDLSEYYGIKRYESPTPARTGGEAISPPPGYIPVYDIDSLQRYYYIFESDELVHVTEKIHGCNARFTYHEGQMYAGSHREWKKENTESVWWKVLKYHPEIEYFCKVHSGIVIYGEIYGAIQKGFNYGLPPGEVRIMVFDLLYNGQWLSIDEARKIGYDLPWVPVVAYSTPFGLKEMLVLARGSSLVKNSNHIREGIVIKPLVERYDSSIGRVQSKLVSEEYYFTKVD